MSKSKRKLKSTGYTGQIDPETIRMVVKAVHVIPQPETDQWEVHKAGNHRTKELFSDQVEALDRARPVDCTGRCRRFPHDPLS